VEACTASPQLTDPSLGHLNYPKPIFGGFLGATHTSLGHLKYPKPTLFGLFGSEETQESLDQCFLFFFLWVPFLM